MRGDIPRPYRAPHPVRACHLLIGPGIGGRRQQQLARRCSRAHAASQDFSRAGSWWVGVGVGVGVCVCQQAREVEQTETGLSTTPPRLLFPRRVVSCLSQSPRSLTCRFASDPAFLSPGLALQVLITASSPPGLIRSPLANRCTVGVTVSRSQYRPATRVEVDKDIHTIRLASRGSSRVQVT